MKEEISLEEMIEKLCVIEISPNEMIAIKQQILSRFSNLQAKVKELEKEKLVYAIMEVKTKGTVIDLLSQVGNLDKKNYALTAEVEMLKCCGNCKSWIGSDPKCQAVYDAYGYCSKYQPDNLTREQRGK